MNRPVREREVDFGSDSFLDIIANIVGILIILIVIAGVKVARQPVAAATSSSVQDALQITSAADLQSESGADEQLGPAEVPESTPEQPATEAPQPKPEVSARPVLSQELLARKRELEVALAAALERLRETHAQLDRTRQEVRQVRAQFASVRAEVDTERNALAWQKQQMVSLERAVENDRAACVQLQRQLRDASETKVIVEQLEHQTTPVGEDVTGDEVHFRLLGGRVAVVPVQVLLQRLKDQVRRQKEWLMRFPRHQGVVGPISGFSMKYTVERARMSVLEELRYGAGMVRIAVTEWKLESDDQEPTETAQEAQRRGSRLFLAMQQASPSATLTFWVYPDSFLEFRELQSFAQAHGFRVAGRPIPFGVPIAGSPRGSRSSAQ